MKQKLKIGAIVLLGLAVAFAAIMLTIGAAVAAWIYLVWQLRKKKTAIFHDQMEPAKVKKRYKLLKTLLLAAAIAFVAGVGGVIAHSALFGLTEMDEPVSFIIALVAFWLFILATGGGVFIFIQGQRKPA